MKLYDMKSLHAYVRRLGVQTIYTQARANAMGRSSLDAIGYKHRITREGVMEGLYENLVRDYDRYVAKERPVIYKLGGSNLWVNSAAASFTIEVLERIRAGGDSLSVHKFRSFSAMA